MGQIYIPGEGHLQVQAKDAWALQKANDYIRGDYGENRALVPVNPPPEAIAYGKIRDGWDPRSAALSAGMDPAAYDPVTASAAWDNQWAYNSLAKAAANGSESAANAIYGLATGRSGATAADVRGIERSQYGDHRAIYGPLENAVNSSDRETHINAVNSIRMMAADGDGYAQWLTQNHPAVAPYGAVSL